MNKVFFLPERLQRKKKNIKIFRVGILVLFLVVGMLIVLFFFPLKEMKLLEKESYRLSAVAATLSKQQSNKNMAKKNQDYIPQSTKLQQRWKGVNLITQQRKLLGENLIFLNNASDPNYSGKGNLQRAIIEKIEYAPASASSSAEAEAATAGNILVEGSANHFLRIIEFVRRLESSRKFNTVRLSKVEAVEGKGLFLFFLSIKLKE